MSDQDEQAQQNADPDEEAGPAVKPLDPAAREGSGEGAQVGVQDEQVPTPVNPGGFDPDQPVSTSGPDPANQSGVPELEGGGNENVEPQPEYAGPVETDEQRAQREEREAQLGHNGE